MTKVRIVIQKKVEIKKTLIKFRAFKYFGCAKANLLIFFWFFFIEEIVIIVFFFLIIKIFVIFIGEIVSGT